MSTPTKYKTTLSFLQSSGIAAVDRILLRTMPEASFGLLTFEADDYEKGNITYFLYNDVPAILPVTVSASKSLEKAVYEIQSLNPHVRFVLCGNAFSTGERQHCPHRVQLLLVISDSMSIDEKGRLLY